MGAERLEQRAAGPHVLFHFRIEIVEKERFRKGHPQPRHAVLQPRQRVLAGHAAGALVAGVLAMQRLVDQCRILHRAGERSHRVERPGKGKHAVAADTAHGGLQPDRAAKPGGRPHRAPRIGTQPHRGQPGGHGHGGAGAGAARHVRFLGPRVVGRALDVVDPHDALGEFHRDRLAQHDHARPRQPGGNLGILGGHVLRQHPRPGGGGQPGDVEDVLHRVGDAMQRPQVAPGPDQPLRRPRLGQRPLAQNQIEGGEGTVERFDPAEQGLGQFHGRKRARANPPAKLGDGLPVEGRLTHGRVFEGNLTAPWGRGDIRRGPGIPRQTARLVPDPILPRP